MEQSKLSDLLQQIEDQETKMAVLERAIRNGKVKDLSLADPVISKYEQSGDFERAEYLCELIGDDKRALANMKKRRDLVWWQKIELYEREGNITLRNISLIGELARRLGARDYDNVGWIAEKLGRQSLANMAYRRVVKKNAGEKDRNINVGHLFETAKKIKIPDFKPENFVIETLEGSGKWCSAAEACEKVGDKKRQALNLEKFFLEDEFDNRSIETFYKARKLFEEVNDHESVLKICMRSLEKKDYAWTYREHDRIKNYMIDYALAYKSVQKALEIADQLGLVMRGIKISKEEKDLVSLEKFYKKALEMAKTPEDKADVAKQAGDEKAELDFLLQGNLKNKINALSRLRKYEEALMLYKSTPNDRSSDIGRWADTGIWAIAYWAEHQGDFEVAIKMYEKLLHFDDAMKICKRIRDDKRANFYKDLLVATEKEEYVNRLWGVEK